MENQVLQLINLWKRQKFTKKCLVNTKQSNNLLDLLDLEDQVDIINNILIRITLWVQILYKKKSFCRSSFFSIFRALCYGWSMIIAIFHFLSLFFRAMCIIIIIIIIRHQIWKHFQILIHNTIQRNITLRNGSTIPKWDCHCHQLQWKIQIITTETYISSMAAGT